MSDRCSTTKICSRCFVEQPLSEFYRRNCRCCRNESARKRYQLNPLKKAEQNQKWVKNNPEKRSVIYRRYFQKHKVERRMHASAYRRNKRKIDPNFRLITNLRTRMGRALQGTLKSDSTKNLLGCSALEFRQWLERQFKSGMSWENYGRGGWHVDHIKPCDSFDLSDLAQQKQCFHYTNCQPLWEPDNIRKGNKI